MNMKLKLSMLAGALALAAAGQASATINAGTVNNGNGDLILSVWDTTSNTSYTEDLGTTMDGFLTGTVVNGGEAFAAGDAGNGGLSQTWAADATMASFLAGANLATTVWNVTATDFAGITGAAGNQANAARVLTTSTTGQSTPQSNAIFKTYSVNGYYDAVNAGITASINPAAIDYLSAAANGASYAGVSTFADNFGGKANFSNIAGIGQSQNFYFMANSAGTSNNTINQFANIAGASFFNLASNGTLTYNVAAVPEPSEWLLMLSGFGLIGFIANRRKNQNTSMTFA